MPETKEKITPIIDQFAAKALQALIAKSPFLDRDGEHGKQISEENMRQFKSDLAATAWEYAHWMMHHRDQKLKEIFGEE